MRVLLDECVPRRLGRELLGHDVRTVLQEGWSGKKNGELLALMTAEGFEVLLTMDQGIRHQRNLQASGVAVVVMIGASNRLADLVPLVPDVLVALSTVKAGDAAEVRSRASCSTPDAGCANGFWHSGFSGSLSGGRGLG